MIYGALPYDERCTVEPLTPATVELARAWPETPGRIGDDWIGNHTIVSDWAHGFAGYIGTELVAIGGCYRIHAGLGEVWMIPHARIEGAKLAFVRYCKELIPELINDLGLHRLQCMVVSADTPAVGFAKAIGFEREAILRCYGPAMEDYDMMVVKQW